MSRANPGDGVVAVCDVGGGSTEVVVGTELLGPAWVRSVDLGSLRLTAALLPSDPPAPGEIEAAREAVREAFEPGQAAATRDRPRHRRQRPRRRRIVGHEYGPDELEHVVDLLASRPAAESADELGIRPDRARTLLAGALILAEVSRRLDVPFTPSRGGDPRRRRVPAGRAAARSSLAAVRADRLVEQVDVARRT